MQKLKTANVLLVLVLVALAFTTPGRAEDLWHFQANLDVTKPGLVEAVLPAGLFFRTNALDSTPALDLALIGPDGNPRSLELYWKEELDARTLKLEPSRIYLDKKKGLIWEAVLPKNFQIENLQIELIGPVGVGQVNVEVKDAQKWRLLIQNAALQNTGDGLTSEIKLEPAVYEQIRLCFQGFDKEFRKAVLQVRSVHIVGRNLAKDYVEKPIRLRFSDEKTGTERVLSASLPGSGLWVEALVLTTDAQFQGTWQLGRQAVLGGKPQFQEVFQGEVTTVNRTQKNLEISIQKPWQSRSLVLKLNPGSRYLGNVLELKMKVRLPRLVFLADKPGSYAAQSGLGQIVDIKETPGDPDRRIEQSLMFSEVIENTQWRPENLVEKFSIAGGPFNQNGYPWRARILIPEPGYYRMVLNPEVGFSADLPGIRLVKDEVQVPYFRGASEKQIIQLPVQTAYDQGKNSSSWTIRFPEPGPQWEFLEFESRGIFERRVIFEIPKPGNTGWQKWQEQRWQNSANQTTTLRLKLETVPERTKEIRVTIAHGDNQPIELTGIKAIYQAPALLFLIHKPGEYFLFSGNPRAAEAKYDLALVQAHLANAIPKTAVMEKPEPVSSSLFSSRIRELFDEKSWGLYAVLGLVTLVLMILIVRLFPKQGHKPEKDEPLEEQKKE